MPTTQELVTIIKEDFAANYSRAKILSYINRAQKSLFNNDCAQTTFLNYSDPSFPIPILSTTAGTLNYDIGSVTLLDSEGVDVTLTINGYTIVPRRIKNVFVMVTIANASGYNRLFYGEQFDWAGVNDNWTRTLSRVTFRKEPGIWIDKSNHQGPIAQFAEDPGTHTDRYYVEFYYEPPELTSESVPLFVSGNEWERAILDGAVGFVEEVDSGESKRLEKFDSYWIPKFKRKMNINMDNRKPYKITARECG